MTKERTMGEWTAAWSGFLNHFPLFFCCASKMDLFYGIWMAILDFPHVYTVTELK